MCDVSEVKLTDMCYTLRFESAWIATAGLEIGGSVVSR